MKLTLDAIPGLSRSRTNYVHGKALLVVECEGTHGRSLFLRIHPFIQTSSLAGEDRAYDWPYESISESGYRELEALPLIKRMKEGDRVRLAVLYSIRGFYDGYYGEYDEELRIEVIRTLRRQPWGPNRKARKRM